jgi:hypothetical protein
MLHSLLGRAIVYPNPVLGSRDLKYPFRPVS